MRNKSKLCICLTFIVLIFVIPFLINLAFKCDSIKWLSAEWSAGDVLGFYGSILGFGGVAWTLYEQRKQSEKDEIIRYKPILDITKVDKYFDDFILSNKMEIGCRAKELPHPPKDEELLLDITPKLNISQDFHFLISNKGRGEAVEVEVSDFEIQNNDKIFNNLVYLKNQTPNKFNDIIVDNTVDFIISFPNYFPLKNHGRPTKFSVIFNIKYKDMFSRTMYELPFVSNFEIVPTQSLKSFYESRGEFEYYLVEVVYQNSLPQK